MAATARQTGPPNILLIMTDQQRWDSLGCYGASWVQTPNLDRLAAEGVLFDHCYTDNPVCTPARASLMTGKPLPGHSVYRLHDVLPSEEVLFSRRLQQRGYQTALFGKLHVSGRIHEESQRHPNDGFDVYEWCLEAPVSMDSPFNGYSRWLKQKDPLFHDRLKRDGRKVLHIPGELHLTHWAAERSIDFIRDADPGRPFFCKMSVFDPHNPYQQYPVEMDQLVNQQQIPEPIPAGTQPVPHALTREREHNYFATAHTLDPAQLRKIRLGYFAMIGFIDQEVGRVLQTLEARGIADNTMVIFCSDHGDMLGDHGLMVKGAFFYDANIRVPLIVRWPAGGLRVGSRVQGLVQLRDLAATVLSAAGADPEHTAQQLPDSLDLLPVMRSGGAGTRPTAVCLYRNSGICDTGRAWDPPIHASMIRDQRYKLSLYHSEPVQRYPLQGQLFDMHNDPQERNDLWPDSSRLNHRLRLTEALLEWLHRRELALGSRAADATPTPDQQLVNANEPATGQRSTPT